MPYIATQWEKSGIYKQRNASQHHHTRHHVDKRHQREVQELHTARRPHHAQAHNYAPSGNNERRQSEPFVYKGMSHIGSHRRTGIAQFVGLGGKLRYGVGSDKALVGCPRLHI